LFIDSPSYIPFEYGVPISITVLVEADIATTSAEGRKEDKEEVVQSYQLASAINGEDFLKFPASTV
jgi:hypothetical protein